VDAIDLPRKGLVVVAHPDDETLWSGGLLLQYPDWDWYLVTLCRAGDPDRAPRFRKLLAHLGARGNMGNLNDNPEQTPLKIEEVEGTILSLLPEQGEYHICLTHGPAGEYTRHLRHEETSRAVLALWEAGLLCTRELWMFAYHDDGGHSFPTVHPLAHRVVDLEKEVWERKYQIITEIYGFRPESWEAKTTPAREGFWCFRTPEAALDWIRMGHPYRTR